MAGSVWGGGGLNGFMQSWRTTDNGLEGRAVLYSDTLYLLDELAMAAGTAASRIAYFLANGQGKARAGIAGEGRPIAEFRVFFLSTGEISLAAKLAEDGLCTMAGQETRFIDLEVDAGAGMGSFESIHGAETPAAFADAVKSACHEHYGHAGREFLRHLLAGSSRSAGRGAAHDGVFSTKALPGTARGASLAGRQALRPGSGGRRDGHAMGNPALAKRNRHGLRPSACSANGSNAAVRQVRSKACGRWRKCAP